MPPPLHGEAPPLPPHSHHNPAGFEEGNRGGKGVHLGARGEKLFSCTLTNYMAGLFFRYKLMLTLISKLGNQQLWAL